MDWSGSVGSFNHFKCHKSLCCANTCLHTDFGLEQQQPLPGPGAPPPK